MNDTKTTKPHSFPLSIGERLGTEVCELFAGAVDRIAVAGSVRRRCKVVHDLDIIAIPRFTTVPPRTLFGDPEQVSEVDRVLDELASSGKIDLIQRGEKAVRFQLCGHHITVDFYVASPETWATLLLIRTGSREHNIFLCTRAKDLGMQLKADGSGLFRGGRMIASESEESIFQALGLNLPPPELRQNPKGGRGLR
ncbi:MAG: hypothetical protein LAO76_02185 [Acidobacteriia bacterium]|jgi:DNA polymerase (family X)|nr:hypothetical protein [Terriglobia bacterium]